MPTIHVDSSDNRITIEAVCDKFGQPVGLDIFNDGRSLRMLVCTLADDPTRGYIAAADDTDNDVGGFGDNECHSSYRRPCLTWWGRGERFPTKEDAIKNLTGNLE